MLPCCFFPGQTWTGIDTICRSFVSKARPSHAQIDAASRHADCSGAWRASRTTSCDQERLLHVLRVAEASAGVPGHAGRGGHGPAAAARRVCASHVELRDRSRDFAAWTAKRKRKEDTWRCAAISSGATGDGTWNRRRKDLDAQVGT